jgi:hypothetical protein
VLCRGENGSFAIVQHDGERWLRPRDPVRVTVPPERLHFFDRNGVRRDA